MDWERDFYSKADQLYEAFGTIEKQQSELATLRNQNAALLQALKHIETAFWNIHECAEEEMLRIAVDARKDHA